MSSAVAISSVGIDFARLKRVRDQIDADPYGFSMFDWVSEAGRAADIGGLAAIDAGFITRRDSRHPVTMRWYDVTPDGASFDHYPYDPAMFRVALNLTAEEAERLFVVDAWPHPYSVDYVTATSPRDRADVAIRRIDLFIRTRGKQ